MVDLGSLGSMAQNAAKNFTGGDSKKETDESNAGESSAGQWSDVGSSAKTAFTDLQNSQKSGEKVDYKELGQVVQEAQKVYSTTDGPKDATSIGKGIASGFFGKDKAGKDQAGGEQASEKPSA